MTSTARKPRYEMTSDEPKRRTPFVTHSHQGPRGSVVAAAHAGTELVALCGFARVPALPLPACRMRCPICARLASEMFPDEVNR